MRCLGKLFIFLNIFFFLLGLGAIGLGVWSIILYRAIISVWILSTIIAAGGLLVLVTFLSCCGAGYDSKEAPQKRKWLACYFFLVLVVILALGACGTFAVIGNDWVTAFVTARLPEMLEFFRALFPSGSFVTADDVINVLMTNLTIVGAFAIGVAGCLVLGLIICGVLMGAFVWKFTLGLGNLVLFVAGCGCIALGVYAYVMYYMLGSTTGAMIVFVIVLAALGAALAILALWGCLSLCCKSRCCACTYGTIILVLFAAIVAILVLTFVYTGSVATELESFCNATTERQALCVEVMSYVLPNETSVADVIVAFPIWVAGNMRMTAACAAWVGGFVLYLVFAAYFYTCCGGKDDEEGKVGRREVTLVEPIIARPESSQPMVGATPHYGNL